ncbi:transglutaminase TgpA family protein [Shewanella litorisediminis]|nr:DUF3488 and transglutaminase-like domain-containing protein [Shewanella litorisediminis]MCL2918844.1 DUF3488 and transglutaminase-like domain-containing protein [Shewanella litorisediminis]
MGPSSKHHAEIIGRSTLFWLLLTHFALIAPLADKSTPWTLAISAICLVWRVGIFYGRVARPPRLLVTGLGIASAVTLALVGKQIGLLNALMNLLILGYSLKTIEILGKRDVRTVILVGYFLIAINLIDNQGIGAMALALALFWLNTQSLLTLYRDPGVKRDALAIKLVLQSLPLAILLFLVLPRLPPLWMVPSLKSSVTGLGSELGFGDISKLTQSDELAFRARFDGKVPANPELYWRALVMEDYDGAHWRQHSGIKRLEREAFLLGSGRSEPVSDPQLNSTTTKAPLSYEVIAEPSGQRWLFGLDVAFSDTQGVVNLPDYRLFALRPLDGRFQYRARAYDTRMDVRLSDSVRRLNLALPDGINPRTRELVSKLKAESSSPKEFIQTLMTRFSTEAYYYTLSPPPVGKAQIDDFLFDNKQGFCVHYATALTFMARAAGIPARLVSGYQGGELNPRAGYVSVYQYMAHAWSEVWFEDQGWVRVDPTAMIAPSRILDGFDATFDPDESYLAQNPFSGHRFKEISWLNNLRLQLASIDYYWSVWVLGFDNERREGLLKGLLGGLKPTRLILFVLGISAAILLFVAWQAGILRLPSKQAPLLVAFRRVEKSLAAMGLPRELAEGPGDYAVRVGAAMPLLAADLIRWAQQFSHLRYSSEKPSPRALKRFVKESRVLAGRIRKQGKIPAATPD